jgi:hypothetical protein
MLIAVVYLYAGSIAQWAAHLAFAFENMHIVLMVPGTPIQDRAVLADENVKFVAPAEALFVVNVRRDAAMHA